MNRERTWLRPWMVGVAAILLLAGVAEAVGGIRAIYIRYTQSASAPGISATDRTWVSSANDHPYFTDTSNVDHDLLAGGGGGGTLASTYNATTAADNLMSEAVGGGPVIIKSYSPQFTGTPAFQVEDSGGTVRGAVDESGDWSGSQFTNPGATNGLTVGGSAPVLVCGGAAVVTASNSTSAPSISSGLSVYLPTATTPTIAPPSGGVLNLANASIIVGTSTNGMSITGDTITGNIGNTNGTLELTGGASGGAHVILDSATGAQLVYGGNSIWVSGSGFQGTGGMGTSFSWYAAKIGPQLTAAATITPTQGLHHVTGATSITTIATTNLPAGMNPTLTLIADGGTITWATGGNIAAGGTITQNKAQRFVYDVAALTWYPVQ